MLVKNFRTIWASLCCGFELDSSKFGKLCEETEQLYFNESNGVKWYAIPSTLHKILKHGQAIIENCPLPIGLMSEEASESNNKNLRNFREHHSRKTSWKDGIEVNLM